MRFCLQPWQAGSSFFPTARREGKAMKNHRWAWFTIFHFLAYSAVGWWIVVQGHNASLNLVRMQYIVATHVAVP